MNRPAIAALTASAAAATACGAPPQAEIGSPDFTALKQAEPLLQDAPVSSTTTSSSTTVTIRSQVVPSSASTFTLPEDDDYPDTPQGDQLWWREQVLACIRSFEGDYTTETGNGHSGAYQFTPSTWSYAVTGAGYPEWADKPASTAPPAVQDAAAWWLYQQAGYQPWPPARRNCA